PNIAANRKLEPRKLTRLVHGDLDWIVMKCLEKERGQRYETANGLAMDVQRYLADESILARPPSAGYRLRKFARKNRRLLATMAGFMLLLIAGVVASTWQAFRARNAEVAAQVERDHALQAEADAMRQRDRAEEGFRQARQAVDDYFTQVSESKLLHVPGMHPLRKELLESARKYYQRFLDERGDDPSLRGDLGQTWYRLGRITDDLGIKPEALAALRKAGALQEELVRAHPETAEYRRDLAQTWWYLGQILN